MRRLLIIATLVAAAVAVPAAHGHPMPEHGQLTFATANPLAAPLGLAENVSYVGGDNGFTGGHVVVQGDRLYLGSYGRGMHIYDISEPASPRRIGQYVPGGARADAPPDAAVFGKRHIAVLNGTRRTSTHSAVPGDARTDRTEFLDVTDPANPELLWTFGPDQVDGESHNGDIVDQRRRYFPSGGAGAQGLRRRAGAAHLRPAPAAGRGARRPAQPVPRRPGQAVGGVPVPRREARGRAVHPHARHHGVSEPPRGGARPA